MRYGDDDTAAAAAKVGLPDGRMISFSKSGHHRLYPDHLTVFNGTLADGEGAGLWRGDLDLTIDEPKLVALAAELGTTIHVIYESDAMFIGRDEPRRLELSHALVRIPPDGETIVGKHPWRARLRATQPANWSRRATNERATAPMIDLPAVALCQPDHECPSTWPSTDRSSGSMRFHRWGPPRLPLRGFGLSFGPIDWEIELEPDVRLHQARITFSLQGNLWQLELFRHY